MGMGNYLRVRGEYFCSAVCVVHIVELPPRARRIRFHAPAGVNNLGTTSACAENTPPLNRGARPHGNYLRVRGEYHFSPGRPGPIEELPPRARRIRPVAQAIADLVGTTSACAENTMPRVGPGLPSWNYLRVRGEYGFPQPSKASNPELPPRARRIRCQPRYPLRAIGTTSACAENTLGQRKPQSRIKNYLRVRGEYKRCSDHHMARPELPPRARRILRAQVYIQYELGTTSACAENTPGMRIRFYATWNYLRVRGEYPGRACARAGSKELPPRARRIPRPWPQSRFVVGTTSACAENTHHLG